MSLISEWGGWICVGIFGYVVAGFNYWLAKRWEKEANEALKVAKRWQQVADADAVVTTQLRESLEEQQKGELDRLAQLKDALEVPGEEER